MKHAEDVKTNLDRLNELLANEDLPPFRKTVPPSLSNIKWLKTALLKRDDLNAELRTLIQMNPKELHSPYAISQTQASVEDQSLVA